MRKSCPHCPQRAWAKPWARMPQIAAELALDMGRHRIVINTPVALEREPGRQVSLHGAIEQRALGLPPSVRRRAVRRNRQCRDAALLHPVNRDGWSWWRAGGVPRDQTDGLRRGVLEPLVNVWGASRRLVHSIATTANVRGTRCLAERFLRLADAAPEPAQSRRRCHRGAGPSQLLG